MAQGGRAQFIRTVVLATILVGLVAFLLIRGQSPIEESVTALRTVLTGENYQAKPLEEAPDLSDPQKLRRPRKYLVPDRRFTGALERIHAFYHPDAPVEAVVSRIDNGWDVTLGDITFQWPDPVDFGDYLSAAELVIDSLEKQTPIQLAENSVPEETIAEFDKRLGAGHLVPLIDTLIEANALWESGHRDPRLLIYAAEIAGRMVTEIDDELEMGDELDAYALYLTALERRFKPYKGTDRREIRLANWLGYNNHARSRADTLDETDPIRGLAMDDYGGQKRMLPYAGASPYERFRFEWWRTDKLDGDEQALFRRVLASRPFDQALVGELTSLSWWGTVQEVPVMQSTLTGLALTALADPPSTVGTAYRAVLADESANATVYEANKRQIDSVMNRYSNPFDPQLWQMLQRFESQPAGPLIDFRAVAKTYRSYLISSIYRVGTHLMDTYSSMEAVGQFLDSIPENIDTELSDYRRWYAAKAGKEQATQGNWAEFESILKEPGTLGHGPIVIAYQACAIYGWERPLQKRTRDAFDRMHELADGRPRYRSLFAYAADTYVFDRFRQLEELEHLKQLAEHRSTEKMIWYAVATRDIDRVREFAADEGNSQSRQVELIEHIGMLEGRSEEQIAQSVIDFRSESITSFTSLDRLMDLHLAQDNNREVIELGKKWLPETAQASGIPEANARVSVAVAYSRLGEYEEAWKVIEPAVPIYNAGSLIWASRVSDKLGEHERARELAEAAVERYTDSLYAKMSLVEWHWNHNDFEAAATVLASPGYRIESSNWFSRFNPPIERVFEGRPREDMHAAARALIDAGFPTIPLARAADRLGKDGHPALALAILLEVHASNKKIWWILPQIYRHMSALDGELHAKKWWVSVSTAREHTQASFSFHNQGAHSQLFELYPPEMAERDEYHGVLQAAACAVDSEIDAKYGPPLREVLERTGDSWYRTLARFLVGMEDPAVIAEHMKVPKKRCEAAYFLGMIAENEGRYPDALQWYLVSTDTGLERNGEFTWAITRLRDFKDRTVTPEIAEAEWREAHGLAAN